MKIVLSSGQRIDDSPQPREREDAFLELSCFTVANVMGGKPLIFD
jgi:hypothetical protein